MKKNIYVSFPCNVFRLHPTDHHNHPTHHINIQSEYKPKNGANVHETFKIRTFGTKNNSNFLLKF